MEILITSKQGDAKELLRKIGYGAEGTSVQNIYATIVEGLEECFYLGAQLKHNLIISGGLDKPLITIDN
jgi:hypothetical protein